MQNTTFSQQTTFKMHSANLKHAQQNIQLGSKQQQKKEMKAPIKTSFAHYSIINFQQIWKLDKLIWNKASHGAVWTHNMLLKALTQKHCVVLNVSQASLRVKETERSPHRNKVIAFLVFIWKIFGHTDLSEWLPSKAKLKKNSNIIYNKLGFTSATTSVSKYKL